LWFGSGKCFQLVELYVSSVIQLHGPWGAVTGTDENGLRSEAIFYSSPKGC
jgi:hypothetical protein